MSAMHKTWKMGTLLLLVILAIHFTMNGFFRQRTMLTDKTPARPKESTNDNKVIFLMVDALREDFVEFDTKTHKYLNPEAPYAYTGRKMRIFKDYVTTWPKNTLLFPLISEMPTVTVVRIKSMLTGALSSVFELSEEFQSAEVKEDNILHQLHQRKSKKTPIISFFGDYIWTPLFGTEFDRYEDFHSLDVRDLDTLDIKSAKAIYEELDSKRDFTLMLAHIIGIDSAGHTYNSRSKEIERKLYDTQEIIHEVINKMDDKTTLIVFGDHGMTDDGNHGGESLLEMRTVLFAYQKTPFPMADLYHTKSRDHYEDMDKTVKITDLASILSVLLDTPFPYSNLGVFHPVFSQESDIKKVSAQMIENLEQIQTYLNKYCSVTSHVWCPDEIAEFETKMALFKSLKLRKFEDVIDHIDLMHEFANTKYDHFKKLWTEYDELSFWIGMLMSIWLLLFHQFVMFGRSEHKQDIAGVTGLAVNWLMYLGAAVFGAYPLWVSAATAFVITFGQSKKQRNDWLRWVYQKISKEGGNYTAKGLVYPIITLGILVVYAVVQVVDSFIQEQDYVYDGLVLFCVGMLWITQPPHLRYRDVNCCLIIVGCVKLMYFLDGQVSMNFDTEEHLHRAKDFIRNEPILTQAVPLVLCVFLENKIGRHYSFGKFHGAMTHGLTAMLFANFVITYVQRPPFPSVITPQAVAAEKDYADFIALIGNMIYMTAICFSLITLFYAKMVRGKSWENVSVKVGFFVAKCAMLVSGQSGPLVYFCMLLELYNFCLLVNHRNDSQPGVTFPIQMFCTVFIMHQYFIRSNHRERIDSINYGKVCPGGVFCGEGLHWFLIVFELTAPFLIGMLLLPLVAKARVMNTFSHLRSKQQGPRLAKVQIPERKKVEQVMVQQQPKVKKVLPTDYVGNMQDAVAYVHLLNLVVLMMSAIFVWWTKQEVIFPQRSAPKYLFDMARAVLILPFIFIWG